MNDLPYPIAELVDVLAAMYQRVGFVNTDRQLLALSLAGARHIVEDSSL